MISLLFFITYPFVIFIMISWNLHTKCLLIYDKWHDVKKQILMAYDIIMILLRFYTFMKILCLCFTYLLSVIQFCKMLISNVVLPLPSAHNKINTFDTHIICIIIMIRFVICYSFFRLTEEEDYEKKSKHFYGEIRTLCAPCGCVCTHLFCMVSLSWAG